MADNNTKGDRNEREAVNILSRVYGGGVDRVHTNGRNDPFRLTDIIAIAPDKPVLFVQVKTNNITQQEFSKYIRKAKLRVPKDNAYFEIWVRIDRQGWKMYRYNHSDESFNKYLETNTCNMEEIVTQFRNKVEYFST